VQEARLAFSHNINCVICARGQPRVVRSSRQAKTIQFPDSPRRFLWGWVENAYNYGLPILYGLTHVSKVGSVFTTLAVSLERYFAVCKPLWIR